MSARFDSFVLLAGMRTGSNHLEASLDALDGVACYGELFNPVFLGAPNRDALFGYDRARREADPHPLLRLIRENTDGLPGFRYFHDHDPRVLDAILDDPRTAKVILTRDPVESFVSLAIARETGQWRLTNPKMAKAAKVRFDGAAFDARLAAQAAFHARVERALQTSGQTAFRLRYEEIGDLDVLNGLAAFLGVPARLDAVPGKLKRQNPGAVADKVENPDEMRAHLAALDPFGPARTAPPPTPEHAWLQAAAHSRLIHAALPGGPGAAVADWLARLDGAPPRTDLNPRDLRRWLRARKGFTSVCVLRHPLDRAHAAWRAVLSDKGRDANTTRRILSNRHGVDLEAETADGFAAFLRFLSAALGGQTSLPIPPDWTAQADLLAGLSRLLVPQRVLREDEAQAELDRLADGAGRPRVAYDAGEAALAAIHQPEHDDLAVRAYRQDFRQFGFRRWGNRRAGV